MAVQVQLCFLLFGTCLFSFLLLLECRKLEGYDFPVFSTKKCPGNQAEWKKRSSAINCTQQNGYMCLPNENLTDLLEFCYRYPRILVQKDLCLYLDKRFSKVDSYNCRRFKHGCPELHYFSSDTYLHQSCMEIENGCFSAEPSCKRQSFRSEHSFDSKTFAINLGVSIPICLLCILALSVIGIKYGICKKRSDIVRDDEETKLLLCGYESIDKKKEYSIKDVIFDQWEQEGFNFISTKACKEVEKIIKSRNLVIVAGHSGSGKSAIIQHIALQYRKQDWTVKPVKKVEDIVDVYYSSGFQKYKTICVFNNPLGKESFDEIYNDSWQRYEKDLKLFLKTAKILMSCRNYIISDSRVARYLVNRAAIVDIDNEKYKLSVDEKHHILTKYTLDINLSYEDCIEIVKVERYFPLLCNLCSRKEKYISKGIRFFTEPVTVLKEEIIGFKEKDKGKYCALALLVLFNDDLCVSDLLKNKDTENKFKHTLKMCGLPDSTPITAIGDNLDSLKDCFVKMIGDRYHFYHDLVMEVTTHVFGTDYPTETIKYADIGLLRKKVRLEDCKEHTDPFTVYLSDNYIEKLGKRLFNELFGNRLIDVVLNPCLKTKRMIEALIKIIQKYPEKLPMLLEKKNLKLKKQNDCTANHLYLTKLAFMGLENDISPLFVLIVYSHTDLSLECLDTLTRMHINFKSSSLLPAVYCNGSMQLFHLFSKDHVKESFTNIWGGFNPIHVVSVFHNYEILEKLIMINDDVNSPSHTWNHLTPLLYATGNDYQEYGYYSYKKPGAYRRDKTVHLLLRYKAIINFCDTDGSSPLYIACRDGHKSTVQLLLSNGADINLCKKNGASSLHIACEKGYDATVLLLLSNGADINLSSKDGVSPLHLACQNGHNSIVDFLLERGAGINLCANDGASPLFNACQNGHDSMVYFLLKRGADINLCTKNGASPLHIACQNGYKRTLQLLLDCGTDINLCLKDGASPLHLACQNGHNSTVQSLLYCGADINLCAKNGGSPLFIACQNRHDSTVQLLLSNGADINLCTEDGASPLHIACQNGHDSTVQLLLSNGADINLCLEYGVRPLYIACENGHDSTVQLLLSNGADINLCNKTTEASPLFIACQNRHGSTVQLLLSNGADTNLCTEDGASPLHIACQNGHDSTVQLLLSNGADINLCKQNGASPLFIACENRHDSTIQLLLSNGADFNLCNEDGVSPLFLACQYGHVRTVQLLLSNGADINLCAKDGVSPLSKACQKGHVSTVQLLLSNGADINLCNKTNGVSPLYIACFNRHDSTVQLLLSNGADINLCAKDGVSPLYIACQYGHDSTVQRLLKRGADINLCLKNGASPLYKACQKGHVSTVQLLLSNGADIYLSNKTNGASPLSIACQKGHDSTVQLLLSNGADINLCDEDGVSPLFLACQYGHDSTVKLLLSNKAVNNLCLKNGVSPLFIACEKGHNSTVQLLLGSGTDINLCAKDGASPLYIACLNGLDRTVQLLLNNRANINLCMKDGVSPLYIAFEKRRYKTVNILLKNGADTTLACGWKVNPDLVDFFEEQGSTVVFLLRKDSITNNMYDPDSYFSLFVSCQMQRVTRMIL